MFVSLGFPYNTERHHSVGIVVRHANELSGFPEANSVGHRTTNVHIDANANYTEQPGGLSATGSQGCSPILRTGSFDQAVQFTATTQNVVVHRDDPQVSTTNRCEEPIRATMGQSHYLFEPPSPTSNVAVGRKSPDARAPVRRYDICSTNNQISE